MDTPTAEHTPAQQTPVLVIMSRPVVAVTGDRTLGEALGSMIQLRLRHLAVVDADGGCQGVLTDRAVAASWAYDPTALDRVRAADVVDGARTLIGVRATVGDAARRMAEGQVDALAVIAPDGRPVGIVTASDLIGLLAADT